MQNEKKLMITLTIEEFIELNKSLISEMVGNNNKPIKEQPEQCDIIYIDDVAQLTGYTPSTIYTKVCRREIPIVSGGRPLTFSKKQLIDWMEKGRPTVAEMIAEGFINSKTK